MNPLGAGLGIVHFEIQICIGYKLPTFWEYNSLEIIHQRVSVRPLGAGFRNIHFLYVYIHIGYKLPTFGEYMSVEFIYWYCIRAGWISQYLPRFGGVRAFSHHQSFYRDQEILPCGQRRIDSVKINPSLLMMRECSTLSQLDDHHRNPNIYTAIIWLGN